MHNNPGLARVDVLGIGISAVDMTAAVLWSERLIDDGGRGYVCLTGVHGIMEAQGDASLRRILNNSYLCLPDGMPTVWIGRAQGHNNMRRVYGPDYMLAMCQQSLVMGFRHFLYGGAPGVVEKLKHRLEFLVPGIRIVGALTPPYGPLSTREETELFAAIKERRPDILWVGLSTPKQEHFMAQYCGRLPVKLLAGVGAAFDLHAGLRSDAPTWMKNCGLQWLHRLTQEPKRLAPRYLRHNPRFLWELSKQAMR
jgi:N-acetylglucosaminyldiphosphoundecaprenol N-acetyl-beta-D-mannosaminyltransferase